MEEVDELHRRLEAHTVAAAESLAEYFEHVNETMKLTMELARLRVEQSLGEVA